MKKLLLHSLLHFSRHSLRGNKEFESQNFAIGHLEILEDIDNLTLSLFFMKTYDIVLRLLT
jgi:hypothetical protein